MRKLYVLHIAFVVITVIAFIPMSVEIFGDMNTDVIIVCARIVQVSMIGAIICALIRVFLKSAGDSKEQS